MHINVPSCAPGVKHLYILLADLVVVVPVKAYGAVSVAQLFAAEAAGIIGILEEA